MTVPGARTVGMGAMPDGEKTAFRVWAPHCASGRRRRQLQRLGRRPRPDGARGGRLLVRRGRRCPAGARVPVLAADARGRALADRPPRPRGDRLGGQRRDPRPGRLRLGAGCVPHAPARRAGHLRAAHRHVPRQGAGGRAARHLPDGHRAARPPGEAGGQRHRDHAGRRVPRQPGLGLRAGAHVRRRVVLRRARGVEGPHQGVPPPGDRRDPRRGLQPPRPQGRGPVAVRRLVGERPRGHLLLQRLAGRDALGPQPPRLQPRARSAGSSSTTR